MKRVKKNSDSGDPGVNSDPRNGSKDVESTKPGLSSMKLMGLLLAVLMAASVMFSLSVVLRDPPSDDVMEGEVSSRVLHFRQQEAESENGLSDKEAHLDDILVPVFDKESCLSRYDSRLFRVELPYKPSSYLVSTFRRYEDLHRRCGPFTEPYKKALEELKSGDGSNGDSDCSYVVWISYGELGNRMLTLASAFLYALLTNRVLLIDPGVDMADLFCEPFPTTSWFLPSEFPLVSQFDGFDDKSPHGYGEMMLKNSSDTPSFVYLHLVHGYDHQEKLFFREENQASLEKIPWLVMKTDKYFVPTLFSIPSFEQELQNLFQNRGTVFHFLARYLFRPTNPVWGLITRYYHTYLARVDQRIGIHVSSTENGASQHLLDQILGCATGEKLLPEVDEERLVPINPMQSRRSKAVLISSMSSGYFERIRDIYWEHPTVTGEIISVHQPSHQEHQKLGKKTQSRRALAEVYLLSLTDVLITSSASASMDVARSLGGLKPWILLNTENGTNLAPPCKRAASMEPCSSRATVLCL